MFSAYHRLCSVSLSKCINVDDESVRALATSCPGLLSVTLDFFFEVSIKLLGIQQTRPYTVLRRSLCPERQGDMPCYVALKERSPSHTSKAGPHEPTLPHTGTEASPVFIRCRTGRMAIQLLPRQGTQRPPAPGHHHTHIH